MSGNTAGYGGGILVDGYSGMTMSNTTVSDNSAEYGGGGGIYAFNSSISLSNSIVANSTAGGDCLVVSTAGVSSISVGTDNIITDGSCATDALSVDPLLGPLADNGGPTFTHQLLAGSPAINAGSASATLLDQRGFRVVGQRDIGAFEFQPIGSDNDGDGISDAYELENGLDPLDASDRDTDPDGDGFSNFEEFEFGTDPQVVDADENNNGIPDEFETSAFISSILFLLLVDDD